MIFDGGSFFGELKYRLWAYLAAATAGLRNDQGVSGPRVEPTVVTVVNVVNIARQIQRCLGSGQMYSAGERQQSLDPAGARSLIAFNSA
jgi:hypothetical protein